MRAPTAKRPTSTEPAERTAEEIARERDEVLFAFHQALPRPTGLDILEWTQRYPQFAEDIRGHAAVALDWAAQDDAATADRAADRRRIAELEAEVDWLKTTRGYQLRQVAAERAEGFRAGLEAALECQPSTAENPNEDSYQRGRFDGVMEFGRAIAALVPSPGGGASSGDGWRFDMEAAPKDGTLIAVVATQYVQHRDKISTERKAGSAMWLDDAWESDEFGVMGDEDIECWMPLPPVLQRLLRRHQGRPTSRPKPV